ncbi:hypothetical protein QN277_020915 [Acacia crassicarpa]|uniref:Uncharacterized protein n=1 Tax=Acacia crassicarpa TaxID=499986 RepID=A0AAE1MLH9_9FABA|nr:hypothetical protein QN277_020915 [Acacia crassicarpa]
MASLILLFSEIVRNHELDAASLLAAYPPPSSSVSSCSAAEKSLRNQNQDRKSHSSGDALKVENPLESRICVDLVWP